ncbi:methionyl-tRNA formyltransferase [Psychroflexus planctonicus]|uniref:Methionyl-tRNA formyltransferase n=1 Tax=Psychroflexus planctonicus TaxID=1526575 RepID=A0ABQ1SLN8_9FLAO|nr:methionyl-tRNA formyltransferase [Psychroflexus planctonicus]GGE41223.1 methionyl-tRNA formyltransferase [Psychroflexus planctonicus]
MEKRLRVCFMGTPEFAVGSLSKITETNHEIVGVVTAVDKPAGRGRKLQESDVKKFAMKNNLPVYQPTNLKSEEFQHQLKQMNPDVIVVVAFRMLPKEVWNFPKYGTFNLHASLLPKYRGAAPIHWSIINGESETGVTSFFIDEKIDTGHIILNRKTSINHTENVGDLYKRLMNLGAELVVETLDLIQEKGTHIETKPQKLDPNKTIPAAPKLTKENTRIEWNNKSKHTYNLIRGLNPFPVAWTKLVLDEEEINVKIFSSTFEITEHNKTPGQVLFDKRKLGIFTQDGILYVEELKTEGKRKMKIIDFLNGFSLNETARFE